MRIFTSVSPDTVSDFKQLLSECSRFAEMTGVTFAYSYKIENHESITVTVGKDAEELLRSASKGEPNATV